MKRSIRERSAARSFPGDAPGMGKRIPLEPGRWYDFDPFLLMAEDWFRKPGGFPDHPHRGIETVTLVLDGELRHADNRGNSGVLHPGDVQWMTAGSGIIHAELPHEQSTVHSLQLWLNLPRTKKMAPAHYQDAPVSQAIAANAGGADIRVISGELDGLHADPGNETPIAYFDARLEAGKSATLPIPAAYNGFVYVLEGSLSLGDNHAEASAGEVAWIDYPSVDTGESVLEVAAVEPARFIAVAGQPIREPVVAYGPFVMCSREEIFQAYQDYHAGRFGGPTAASLEV